MAEDRGLGNSNTEEDVKGQRGGIRALKPGREPCEGERSRVSEGADQSRQAMTRTSSAPATAQPPVSPPGTDSGEG